MLFYDEINSSHTTDLDIEESERIVESDARELLKFLKPLKTKRNLLYIRNQSVPRSKHLPSRL